MKRLLLVSTISLFSASVYGMNTKYSCNTLSKSALQQQLQRCNQNNNKKTDYELAQLVTGTQTLELYKKDIVKFVPTITRPQHNHPAILTEKHIFSIGNADRIKAMSGNTITVKPLVKEQTTESLSIEIPTKPKHHHLAIPKAKHLILPGNAAEVAAKSGNTITVKRLIKKQATRSLSAVFTTPLIKQLTTQQLPKNPIIMITLASPDKNQQTTHIIPAKKINQ